MPIEDGWSASCPACCSIRPERTSPMKNLFTALAFSTLTLGVLAPLAWVTPPAPEPPGVGKVKPNPLDQDLSGVYELVGYNADGAEEYRGTSQLKRARPGLYTIQYATGGNSYLGVAYQEGPRLSVSWAIHDNEKLVRGLSLYEIKEQGKVIQGKWLALPGDGRWRKEDMLLLKSRAGE